MSARSALTVTINDLRLRNACDLSQRIIALEAYLSRRVGEAEAVSLATWAEVTPNISDLIWALRIPFKGGAIAVMCALRAAKRVLPYAGQTRPTCEAAIMTALRYTAGTASLAELYSARDGAAYAACGVSGVARVAFAAVRDATRAASYIHGVNCNYAFVVDDARTALTYASAAVSNAAAERAAQRADLLALLME